MSDTFNNYLTFNNHLSPLGFPRLIVLSALGGESAKMPGYFNPPAGADIFVAYRDHVARLCRQWADDAHPITRSLLAAARLLNGELTAADEILDCLPAEPTYLPFGSPYIPQLMQRTLRAALPLPDRLGRDLWPYRLSQGSEELVELRRWLADNREHLVWHEADGIYRFG